MKIYEVYDNFCGERTTYGYSSSKELAEEKLIELEIVHGPFRIRCLEITEHEVDDFSDWL